MVEIMKPSLSPLKSPILSNHEPRIRHGYFTRLGGVSDGIYRGLNVGIGSSEDARNVQENRQRVAGFFGQSAPALSTLYQIHSPDVIVISDRNSLSERPKADAQVTAEPGVILGILTADCGPVLFADPHAGVIGAAHAGWKGAFTGVLENTIESMIALGASRENITAALGPSISGRNYEVGPEFVERFIDRDPAWSRYFTPSEKQGHSMFDLPGFTLDRLKDAGIEAENLDVCTYADPERFFSYRRTTHAGEPDYGRQISAIMIEG